MKVRWSIGGAWWLGGHRMARTALWRGSGGMLEAKLGSKVMGVLGAAVRDRLW